MRNILLLFCISCMISPAFAKSAEKLDVKSNNFGDLGRYIQKLEINDSSSESESKTEKNNVQNNSFEEQAISDVAKRYEKNAVILNFSDDVENADNIMSDINSSRIFSLKVNETKYQIESAIKNENMIWDGSKAFSQAFLTGTRQMAPIPGVINSQSIKSKVSPSLSASLGQTYLYDANGPSVLFVRANESTYNTGSVISYKGDGLNLSVGSFSSSYNHAASGGAVLSTNSLYLPKKAGSLVLGGAYFANEAQEDDKITGGGFVEYTYKRLKLNAQIGQSRFSNASDPLTSLYLIPEFRICDSIYLKTRFIRNITQDTMQDEFAITYKPKKSDRNFEFEINATNQYTQNYSIKQRIKFSTSFKI